MSGVQTVPSGTQAALGTQGCSPAPGCSALWITLTWQRESGTSLGGGTCPCGDNTRTALVEGHPGAGAAAAVLWDGAVSTGGTPIPPGPTAAHTGLGMGAWAPSMGPAMLSPRYS